MVGLRAGLSQLIEDIVNDPGAKLPQARLLLLGRRNILAGIEDNVIGRLKLSGAIQDVPSSVPLLQNIRDLLTAVRNLAELDTPRPGLLITPERAAVAEQVVRKCEEALASVERLMQNPEIDEACT